MLLSSKVVRTQIFLHADPIHSWRGGGEDRVWLVCYISIYNSIVSSDGLGVSWCKQT